MDFLWHWSIPICSFGGQIYLWSLFYPFEEVKVHDTAENLLILAYRKLSVMSTNMASPEKIYGKLSFCLIFYHLNLKISKSPSLHGILQVILPKWANFVDFLISRSDIRAPRKMALRLNFVHFSVKIGIYGHFWPPKIKNVKIGHPWWYSAGNFA